MKRNRKSKISPWFKPIILLLLRKIIVNEKIIPSLSILHERLEKQDFDMYEGIYENPEWFGSKETLRRFTMKSGFTNAPKATYYQYLREQTNVINQRIKYLNVLKSYRQQGYYIFFQDETWLSKNMSVNKIWSLMDPSEPIDYQVPSSPGTRSTIFHIGSKETGLLEDCLLMFDGSHKGDFQDEMNGKTFMDWLKMKVFPTFQSFGQKCVLVIDRAKYHTMQTDNSKPPSSAWKKEKLSDAILRWGGPDDDDWPILFKDKKLKIELLQMENRLKPE